MSEEFINVLRAALVAAIFFAAACVPARIARWWRRGCMGCWTAHEGGSGHVPHTCLSWIPQGPWIAWRNPYRDRRGRLWEFGRRVDCPTRS